MNSPSTSTRAAILKVRDAFGAPGDYGYDTTKGAALHGLYDHFNMLAALALLRNLPDDEEQPLANRLAACLALIIDTPLISLHDPVGNFAATMDIYLGSFLPELSERAAGLLEEAGL